MAWWPDEWTTQAKSWCYGKFDNEEIIVEGGNRKYSVNEEYLHIHLKSVQIVDSRQHQPFYPVLHSFISIAHRAGQPVRLNAFSAINPEEPIPADSFIFCNDNKPVLGPIPYKGGSLEMEIGLFSVRPTALVKPYLSLLTEISETAGVCYISSSLPFVDPIKNAVQRLTAEQEGNKLELGISVHYPEVEPGYYAVVRASENQLDFKDLKIGTDFRLMRKNGRELKEFPYLVYEISTSRIRNDWFYIPEILQSYKKIQEDLLEGLYSESTRSLENFRRTLYLSNDLIFDDARKIYSVVSKEFMQLVPGSIAEKRLILGGRQLKNLDSFEIL